MGLAGNRIRLQMTRDGAIGTLYISSPICGESTNRHFERALIGRVRALAASAKQQRRVAHRSRKVMILQKRTLHDLRRGIPLNPSSEVSIVSDLAGLLARVRLLPGADRFLHEHARALPQPDQLCGPFLGSLAIAAGTAVAYGGTGSVIDLAKAARSALWPRDLPGGRPPGESPHPVDPLATRRLDQAASPWEAGTQAFRLGKAIEEMSPLCCIPASGTWTAESVATLLNPEGSGDGNRKCRHRPALGKSKCDSPGTLSEHRR